MGGGGKRRRTTYLASLMRYVGFDWPFCSSAHNALVLHTTVVLNQSHLELSDRHRAPEALKVGRQVALERVKWHGSPNLGRVLADGSWGGHVESLKRGKKR